MEELTVILLAILIFCLTFYIITTQVRAYRKLKQISGARRVLLVTSHPDDETMFFGPTILSLTRGCGLLTSGSNGDSTSKPQLFLLCMSNGNFRNNGTQRKEELYSACQVLKIAEQNITILSYTRLPDDPGARWREEVVAETVLQMIAAYEIDTVLTFDRGGVSGHPNHTSLYNGMVFLSLENRLPAGVSVYTLRTVNLLRKYSSFLDIPMSFLLGKTVYVAGPGQWTTLCLAMRQHASQFVWFRKLYMLFSRYCLINTYEKLDLRLSSVVKNNSRSNVSSPATSNMSQMRTRRNFHVTAAKVE